MNFATFLSVKKANTKETKREGKNFHRNRVRLNKSARVRDTAFSAGGVYRKTETTVKANESFLDLSMSSIVEAFHATNLISIADMHVRRWAEVVAGSFGAELTKLRKSRGISMNELSIRTGLARSFITYMEKGERIPSLETLARIGYALGVSPGELVKRTEKAAGPVPRFKKNV